MSAAVEVSKRRLECSFCSLDIIPVKIRASMTDRTTIKLVLNVYDDIGTNKDSFGEILSELSNPNLDNVDLDININSGGGKLTSFVLLIDTITNSVKEGRIELINTYASYYCMSAAIYLYMLGEVRFAYSTTEFLIHSTSMSLNTDDLFSLDHSVRMAKATDERLHKRFLLNDETKISKKLSKKIIHKGKALTGHADYFEELGIVSTILDASEY